MSLALLKPEKVGFMDKADHCQPWPDIRICSRAEGCLIVHDPQLDQRRSAKSFSLLLSKFLADGRISNIRFRGSFCYQSFVVVNA